MVEAAGQEGIVLKIFEKATWCLVGAGSCDPRRGGVQSSSTTAVYMHPWMVF